MEREGKEEEKEKEVIEGESINLPAMNSSVSSTSQSHEPRDPPSPPVDTPFHSPSSSDSTPLQFSPKEEKNSEAPLTQEPVPSTAAMQTPSAQLQRHNPPSPSADSPLHSSSVSTAPQSQQRRDSPSPPVDSPFHTPSSSDTTLQKFSPKEEKNSEAPPPPESAPSTAAVQSRSAQLQRHSPPSPLADSPLHSPSSSEVQSPELSPIEPNHAQSQLPPAKPRSSVSVDSPLHSPSSSERTAFPAPAPGKPPSVAVTHFPPLRRPHVQFRPPSPATDSPLHSLPSSTRTSPAKATAAANRYVPEEAVTVSEVAPRADEEYARSGETVETISGNDAAAGGGGGKRWKRDLSILRRVRREKMVKRALMGSRVCALIFCLVSFSVMAADRYEGWALDSFYRYKEFRYCVAVNVIGFIYSALQAFDVAYYMATGKHLAHNHMRYYLDFSVDQILSYLLISASSSAATRIEDWESNWGKDKFTNMAFASVVMSFMAFGAFALSSVISGYTLFTINFI